MTLTNIIYTRITGRRSTIEATNCLFDRWKTSTRGISIAIRYINSFDLCCRILVRKKSPGLFACVQKRERNLRDWCLKLGVSSRDQQSALERRLAFEEPVRTSPDGALPAIANVGVRNLSSKQRTRSQTVTQWLAARIHPNASAQIITDWASVRLSITLSFIRSNRN